jgi:hypothetical protein
MNFGHLLNNRIIPATQPIRINDRDYFTNDPSLMLEAGEKEIIRTEKPINDNIKGKYIRYYEETDTQIIQKWNFVEYTDDELLYKYHNLTVKYIREKYSINEENKVIREFLAYNTDEYRNIFNEYNSYVEECKKRAHTETYGE